MALLCETATGRTVPLETDHAVGRAPTCPLRLHPRYVSAQQAHLRWTGARWELKDLNSRNGTFIDGILMEPGRFQSLPKGARIAFGKASEEWTLADDAPPSAMAVPLGDGDALVMEGNVLALPSSDDPRLTIYRDIAGCWMIEQPDEPAAVIKNAHVFEVGGRWWRFSCPEEMQTSMIGVGALAVRDVELSISYTRDEEHVELRLVCGGRVIDMGARSRFYLLLTLARRRIADAEAGFPESSCGWLSLDERPNDSCMAPAQLSLDTFRIRSRFREMGFVDASKIIERRPGQIRIGCSRISLHEL